MTRPNPSTALGYPLNQNNIEGVRAENNLLHRRVLMLTHLEIRLRAALELATGVSWDSENIIDLDGDQLKETVANNMALGLNIDLDEARRRVRHHAAMAHPAQSKSPEADIAANVQGIVLPQART